MQMFTYLVRLVHQLSTWPTSSLLNTLPAHLLCLTIDLPISSNHLPNRSGVTGCVNSESRQISSHSPVRYVHHHLVAPSSLHCTVSPSVEPYSFDLVGASTVRCCGQLISQPSYTSILCLKWSDHVKRELALPVGFLPEATLVRWELSVYPWPKMTIMMNKLL